jgi:HEAT repeat protein
MGWLVGRTPAQVNTQGGFAGSEPVFGFRASGQPPALAPGRRCFPATRLPTGRVRQNAAGFLASINPAPQDVVPALIAALKDNDAGVRQNVAMTLGFLGPAVKGADPALIAVLKDNDAVAALMIVALKDNDLRVRQSAAEALGKIVPWTQDAPTLTAKSLRVYRCEHPIDGECPGANRPSP